jgi:hypothetical protein
MQASIDWLGRRGAPDLPQDQGDSELASALDRRICVVLYAHMSESVLCVGTRFSKLYTPGDTPLSMPLWYSMHTCLCAHKPVALASPFRALACYSPFNITHLLPLSYTSVVWHHVMQLCLLSFSYVCLRTCHASVLRQRSVNLQVPIPAPSLATFAA